MWRWLTDEHGATATDIRQAHIDTWLAEGPSTRQRIRTFVVWMTQSRQIHPVTVPHRVAKTSPMLDQTARIRHIGRCPDDPRMPTRDRLASLILHLYAHPVGDIAALRTTAIETRPDGLYLRLGTTAARMPAPMATIAWEHLPTRANQQTTNTNTTWLFPGTLAGHHTSPESLLAQLRHWGLDLGGARNAALRELVTQLTPAALAKQLGYSPQIISKHATEAAAPTADYPALKRQQLQAIPRATEADVPSPTSSQPDPRRSTRQHPELS